MSALHDHLEEQGRQRRALKALLDDCGGSEKALSDMLWAMHATFEEAREHIQAAKPLPLAQKIEEIQTGAVKVEPTTFAPAKRPGPFFPDAKLDRKHE